jgi:hypothetical protein
MDDIYAFIYRGVLTDVRLDSIGRQRNKNLNALEAQQLIKSLNFDLLDQDMMVDAQRMALVYIAIHTVENMIRNFVSKTLAEEYGENWWEQIPEKISGKVTGRMNQDKQFRWHGIRGKSEIMYSDFADLQSIIYHHWDLFKDTLITPEWTGQVLLTLEKSRNIVMHGGVVDQIDIERIGINIRDWIRQVG